MLLRRYHKVKEKKPNPLTLLTVAELKELAKDAEIEGYKKMKKSELIDALEAIKAELNKEVDNSVTEETDQIVGE